MNPSPVVRIGGGGSLFPWYAGYLKYVTEHFDVNQGNVTFIGESTGAFMAVCVACGVDLDEAIDAAIKIHVENDIDMLLYVWGSLVRSWIDALLPEDAADKCTNGRVKIAVTQMPWFRRRYITHFHTKSDVVEAAMASAHVPFVMDGKFATKYHGRWYIDGCVGFDVLRKGQLCLSYTDDKRMNDAELSMIKIIDSETAQCIKNWGYTYARDLDASGFFEAVLGQCRLKK